MKTKIWLIASNATGCNRAQESFGRDILISNSSVDESNPIGTREVLEAYLSDLEGKVIDAQRGKGMTFDLRNLPGGIYVLMIRNNGSIHKQPIIKAN